MRRIIDYIRKYFDQSDEIRGLREELAEKEKMLDTFLHIDSLDLREGKTELEFSGLLIPFLATSMYDIFEEAGGVNYVEWVINSKDTAEKGPFTLTFQRVHGRTPAQLRRIAEERVVELQNEIDSLRQEKQ